MPERIRPPRPLDKIEAELPGESSYPTRMDHKSKHGGSLPPLFRGSPAQSGVGAAPSTDLAHGEEYSCESSGATILPQKTLLKLIFGKHRSESQNRYKRPERGRPRAETELTAVNIFTKETKNPCSADRGAGIFPGLPVGREPRRSSAAPSAGFCEIKIRAARVAAGCSPGTCPELSPSVVPSPRAP